MKAVAYARFSSDNQREESIDAQLRAIREYCAKNSIDLVSEYTDEAKSATTDNRPQFQQMFSELSSLKVQYVIVHKLDRFSRDRYDSAYYKRELKQKKIRLISVLEPLDDSPESVILESVLEGMAEYYSKNLARETLKGLKETAYKCLWCGGTPPLGYDIIDQRLVINASEADIVRKIFVMYANGCSYNQILHELDGKTTKRGLPFGKNSLNSILHNEKYTGLYTYGRQSKQNKNSHTSNDDMIRIPMESLRIIPDETFVLVQERLKNQKHNAKNKAVHDYMLSGKIICSCGATMIGYTSTNTRGSYSYYICNNKYRNHTCTEKNIPAKKVERSVLNIVAKRFRTTQNDVDYVYSKILKGIKKTPEKLKIRGQITEIDTQITNIITAIKNGAYSPLIQRELDALTANKQKLETQLNEYPIPTKADVRIFLEQFGDIRNMEYENQKKIIQSAIKKITVCDSTVNVEFRIPMVAGARNPLYPIFSLTGSM